MKAMPRDLKERVSFRLPPETCEQLQQICESLHISKSAVVSLAIARLAQTDPVLREQKEVAHG